MSSIASTNSVLSENSAHTLSSHSKHSSSRKTDKKKLSRHSSKKKKVKLSEEEKKIKKLSNKALDSYHKSRMGDESNKGGLHCRSFKRLATSKPNKNSKYLRKSRVHPAERQSAKVAAIATAALCYLVVTFLLAAPVGAMLLTSPLGGVGGMGMGFATYATLPLVLSAGKSMRASHNPIFWQTLAQKGVASACKVYWKNMKIDSFESYKEAWSEAAGNYLQHITTAVGVIGLRNGIISADPRSIITNIGAPLTALWSDFMEGDKLPDLPSSKDEQEDIDE